MFGELIDNNRLTEASIRRLFRVPGPGSKEVYASWPEIRAIFSFFGLAGAIRPFWSAEPNLIQDRQAGAPAHALLRDPAAGGQTSAVEWGGWQLAAAATPGTGAEAALRAAVAKSCADEARLGAACWLGEGPHRGRAGKTKSEPGEADNQAGTPSAGAWHHAHRV
jgi:hypothetical protein